MIRGFLSIMVLQAYLLALWGGGVAGLLWLYDTHF